MTSKDKERIKRLKRASCLTYACSDEELAKLLHTPEYAKLKSTLDRHIANQARRDKHVAYTSCGMVRVRGALGGVYYE